MTNTGNATESADANTLETACRVAAQKAEQVHKWLKPILQGSAASKGCYRFKDRTKPWNEIWLKVLGKRQHEKPELRKPNYTPENVTDVSGFRIVSLFNSDIPTVLDALFALFKAPLPPGAAPGRFGKLGEVIFYTSRRLDDPLSILPDVRKVVKKHGHQEIFKEPPAEDPFATTYSSVHVVIECRAGEDDFPSIASTEIQLRSVFEEAWSEINHTLLYGPLKRDRAKGSNEPANLDADKRWLDALKSLTDGCAQYADLINDQLKKAKGEGLERSPRSLDDASKTLDRFRDCSPTVWDAVSKAIRLRQEAEGISKIELRGPIFIEASKSFAKALAALEEDSRPADDAVRIELINILKEELAYCRMFSGDPELISRAENSYRELVISGVESPTVFFRLGQILMDAGKLEEARDFMERGLSLAESKPEPPDKLLWLLRRGLAYVVWRIVDVSPQHPDAIPLLERAISLSEAAMLSRSDPPISTALNFLYYMTDLNPRVSGERKIKLAERAKALLRDLESKLETEQVTLEQLDTLVRAERDFGDPKKARLYAARVLKELRGKMAHDGAKPGLLSAFEALSRDERDMYLCAQALLSEFEEK